MQMVSRTTNIKDNRVMQGFSVFPSQNLVNSALSGFKTCNSALKAKKREIYLKIKREFRKFC